MTRIIGIVNLKGGVGKTTTCVNLGASLAQFGLRILLIDLDPQKSLTGWADIDHQPTAGDILTGRAELAEAIVEWQKAGCWILPAGKDLRAIESHLASFAQPEYILKYKLKNFDNFDYVLIDNSPSYGLLNINAMCASDEIIIPLQTEILALESSIPFFETLGDIRRKYHPGLKIGGILATMYDARTNLSKIILDQMRASEHLGPLMLKTFIRKNVKLAETPSLGYPITRYSTAYGTEDYRALAAELLTDDDRAKIAQMERNSEGSMAEDDIYTDTEEHEADADRLEDEDSQLLEAVKKDDNFV
jgi:chromosome partitioning protein